MKNKLFEDFSLTPSGRRCARLVRNKFRTPQQLFEIVQGAVTEVVPYLDEGQRYTTEDLCGPDMWASFFQGEQKAAGMCLAYLESVGEVSLDLCRATARGGKKYYMLPVAPKASCDATHVGRAGSLA